MLKAINIKYLTFATWILVLFIPFVSDKYGTIYLLNFITLFAYYYIIHQPLSKPDSYFSKERLGFTVFFYSLFFVILYKLFSYYYNSNFFVFSLGDAMTYHDGALEIISRPFVDGILYAIENWPYDDLGAFILVSTLYRFIESNLILNFFYIVVGVITAFSIFSIAKNFISVKYSFLCSLVYSTSSFVIWFHSSGLKESVMVLLIILFYDHYYTFLKLKTMKNLLLSVVFLLLLLLFRPALTFFCVASIGLGILFEKKITFSSILMIILGISSSLYLYSFITLTADRFLLGGTDQIIASKDAEGMIIGGVSFTYAVNALAALLGPLPTVFSNTKLFLIFISIGLIYRVFISTAFWIGVYYVIKNKVTLMYPLLLFIFMEMISLTYILEALEFRKSLPHIAFVFIISFWFLDKYDNRKAFSKFERYRIKNVWNFTSILFFLIIIYWNFR